MNKSARTLVAALSALTAFTMDATAATKKKARPPVTCDQLVPPALKKFVVGYEAGGEKLIRAYTKDGKIMLTGIVMGLFLPPINSSIGYTDQANPNRISIREWLSGEEITAMKRALKELNPKKRHYIQQSYSRDREMSLIIFNAATKTVTASGQALRDFPDHGGMDAPAETIPYDIAPQYVAYAKRALSAVGKCKSYINPEYKR